MLHTSHDIYGKRFLYKGSEFWEQMFPPLLVQEAHCLTSQKFASLDPEDLILSVVNGGTYSVDFGPISLKYSVEISSLILEDQE